MPREKRDVIRALLNKGFQERPGDHTRLIYVRLSGQQSHVNTMTSRSPKVRTLDEHLLSLIAKQIGLTRPELSRFLDCEMSQLEYEGLLVERGMLAPR